MTQSQHTTGTPEIRRESTRSRGRFTLAVALGILAATGTASADWRGDHWVDQVGTGQYVKTNKTSLVYLSQSSAATTEWRGSTSRSMSLGSGSAAVLDLMSWYGRSATDMPSLAADLKEDQWITGGIPEWSRAICDEKDAGPSGAAIALSILTFPAALQTVVQLAPCRRFTLELANTTGGKGVLPVDMERALTKWTPGGYVLKKWQLSRGDLPLKLANGSPVLMLLFTGKLQYRWVVVTGASGTGATFKVHLAQGEVMEAFSRTGAFSNALKPSTFVTDDDDRSMAFDVFGFQYGLAFWYEKTAPAWDRGPFNVRGSVDDALSSCRGKVTAGKTAKVEVMTENSDTSNSYRCGYEHLVCTPAAATISLTDTGIKVVGLPPNGSFTLYQGPIGGGQSSSASTKAADSRGQFAYTIPTYPMAFEVSVNGTCTDTLNVRAMKPLLVSDGPKIRISRLPAGGQFELITNKGTPPMRKTYTYTASANGTYVYTNVVGGATQCSASSPCKFQAKVLDKSSDWLTHNAGVPADSVAAPAPVQRR